MTGRNDNRGTRKASDREAEKRPESYTPPPLLPMPEDEEGYVFKWIRKSTHGQLDSRNMARRSQQGWVICRKEEYPDVAKLVDPFNNTGEYIESGGLLLAKLPLSTAMGIREYNERRARAQVKAVDNNYFSLKDRGVQVFRDPDSRTYTDRNKG